MRFQIPTTTDGGGHAIFYPAAAVDIITGNRSSNWDTIDPEAEKGNILLIRAGDRNLTVWVLLDEGIPADLVGKSKLVAEGALLRILSGKLWVIGEEFLHPYPNMAAAKIEDFEPSHPHMVGRADLPAGNYEVAVYALEENVTVRSDEIEKEIKQRGLQVCGSAVLSSRSS